MKQYSFCEKDRKNSQRDSQKSHPVSFEKFLLLAELKRKHQLQERQQRLNNQKEKKDLMLNKIKILPPMFQKGFREYNPELNSEITCRKISFQAPAARNNSQQCVFPAIIKNQGTPCRSKWSLLHRRDEINSMTPHSIRLATLTKIQKSKTQKKESRSDNRLQTQPTYTYNYRKAKSNGDL